MTLVTERVYRPWGACDRLFDCREPEVVVSGPAGTGKSRACLEYVHTRLLQYAGARALVVRKTLTSLVASGMVTFREKVLDPHDGIAYFGGSRVEPAQYRYPNGSRMVMGGMDKPSKIMSSEYDLEFAQEATELTENDWESLTTRLRNGAMPYQQLIADCNPDAPTHWLKQRCDAGRTLMLESRHEDNPMLYDRRTKDWTPDGALYMSKLDALTGVRFLRLRKGIWAAAEGLVYEGWDRAMHIIPRFDVPAHWPRYLAVDFGFTNAFVCQWWAEDPDGRLYRYREIYQTKRLVEDHAQEIKRLWAGEPRPRAIICDHDAEDRATLERHLGMHTLAATKNVSAGIQAVASRLKPAGDGKPRLFLMQDSLARRDPDLVDAKLPTCFEEELEGYVWSDKRTKDEPVKDNDHGCLAAGTMVETSVGAVPIERVTADMLVLTRCGYRRVLAAGMTGTRPVFEMRLSDGRRLAGTGDHPVYVDGLGYTALRALRYGAIIRTVELHSEEASCQGEHHNELKPLSTRGSPSGAIPTRQIGQTPCTLYPTRASGRGALGGCIRRFGGTLTALFQRAAIFTTRMAIRSTTRLTIWCASMARSIRSGTALRSRVKRNASVARTTGPACRRVLPSGTVQMWAVNGTEGLHRKPMKLATWLSALARYAGQSMRLITLPPLGLAFAPMPVSLRGAGALGLTTKQGSVSNVAPCSQSTSMPSKSAARASVLSVTDTGRIEPVYNLTVDAAVGEYFANGILVHNCDAARYMCAYKDLAGARARGKLVTF